MIPISFSAPAFTDEVDSRSKAQQCSGDSSGVDSLEMPTLHNFEKNQFEYLTFCVGGGTAVGWC